MPRISHPVSGRTAALLAAALRECTFLGYMRAFFRLRTLCAVLGLLLWSTAGRAAWTETRVKAHTATLDVERDGSATVQHEVVLGVRGGPLREFEIQGLDPDAEPAGVATAVPRVRYGVPTPIPVSVSRGEDGTLKLGIPRNSGLRTGSYTLAFRYKTQLLLRDRLRRRGASAELEWIGPRFADGIDVAKVIFRLPEGPTLPVLSEGVESDDSALMANAFLSSVRHVSGKAEITLVRPYIARGEPAVWRVLASAQSFDGLPEPPPRFASGSQGALLLDPPRQRLAWLFSGVLLALAYGGLVLLKWSLHRRDCLAAGAEPRPLVPLPSAARAALAGCLFTFSVALGGLGDHPTLAALALLITLSLAALRAPRVSAIPRGPGQWLALNDADAFTNHTRRAYGRWLDAGTGLGAGMLALLGMALIWVCAGIAAHSPYHALALGLAASALLPVFVTGRVSSLPVDFCGSQCRILRRIAERLRAGSALRVVAWARIADGARDPDELRVLVRVPCAKDGLLSIEVGLEQQRSLAGFVSLPFVLVRVREDSEAQAALPRSLLWQRGRKPNERVALVRPALPTVGFSSALVEELAAQVSGVVRTNSRRTLGGPSVTARIGVRSPAHAS